MVYLLRRRRANQQTDSRHSQEPTQSAPDTSENSESSSPNTDTPTTDNPPAADLDDSQLPNLKESAHEASEGGEAALESRDLESAKRHFEAAVEAYQTALDEADDRETRSDLEAQISQVRRQQDRTRTIAKELETLITSLESAEQAFHDGIGPYLNGKTTVPKIRCRQARDSYQTAINLLTDTDETLLEPPVTIEIDRGSETLPTSFDDHPTLTEETKETLSKQGVTSPAEVTDEVVDSLDDLSSEEKEALRPLCWWHAAEQITFDSLDKIESRKQQAVAGLDAL